VKKLDALIVTCAIGVVVGMVLFKTVSELWGGILVIVFAMTVILTILFDWSKKNREERKKRKRT